MSRLLKTKIIKIGNSKGIILPSPVINTLGLEVGDQVKLAYHHSAQTLTLTFPKTKQLKLKLL